jgi:hypothetical protein
MGKTFHYVLLCHLPNALLVPSAMAMPATTLRRWSIETLPFGSGFAVC